MTAKWIMNILGLETGMTGQRYELLHAIELPILNRLVLCNVNFMSVTKKPIHHTN